MKKEKIILMKNLKKELYNLKYFLHMAINASPGYAIASFIQSIFELTIPLVGVFLPKYIIDELMGAKRISVLFSYVLIAAIMTLSLSIILNILKRYMKIELSNIMVKFELEIGKHNMKVPYENLEDVKYIELKNSAMMPIRERMTLFFMMRYIPNIISNILTSLTAMCIILKFDFISLIVVLIPTLLIAKLNHDYQKEDLKNQKETVKIQREFLYYFDLMSDFGYAKDIRLYKMQELLMKRNNECDDRILEFKKKSGDLRFGFEGKAKILEGLRSTFVYGYIGIKSIMEHIGIGNFTMYIGVASMFSNSMAKLLENVVTLRQDCRYLDDYIKLQETPIEEDISGNLEIDINNLLVEFKHVTFHYPGAEHDVLKDISFSVRPKESVSIVGSNGAGKTTIIKLLARLFKPTEGMILINGVDIQSIDANIYQKIVSVVFQDFKILQFNIAENIAAGQEVDNERLKLALNMAGIMEKINSLQYGTDTFIGKQFDNDGTEFSGGELQKLAIARALYKKSSVIVLDEPTAALDPYAEEEVYERFHKLTEGRTTVYISHRLSSCKFCDRILFLDDGKIVDDGSHFELMKSNGKYAEMFRIQASQYIA